MSADPDVCALRAHTDALRANDTIEYADTSIFIAHDLREFGLNLRDLSIVIETLCRDCHEGVIEIGQSFWAYDDDLIETGYLSGSSSSLVEREAPDFNMSDIINTGAFYLKGGNVKEQFHRFQPYSIAPRAVKCVGGDKLFIRISGLHRGSRSQPETQAHVRYRRYFQSLSCDGAHHTYEYKFWRILQQ